MNSPLLQPAALLAMLYGGVLAGVAYDGCRLLRRVFVNKIVGVVCDALFVLLAGGLGAFSLLWATGGALRAYAALGFLMGFGAEQFSISRIFFKIFHKFTEIVHKSPIWKQEKR